MSGASWRHAAQILGTLARAALQPPAPIDPVRPPARGWQPSLWASPIPLRSPGNFLEVFRALRENADNLEYAWRILRDGVCDGCALGTRGLHDWTMENIHLCNVRLRLLRLNTQPALDIRLLEDVGLLQEKRSRELRALGRLPYPLRRTRGERGFRRISWDEALEEIAAAIRRTDPDRTYFYLTSRGEPNENYYALQKAVRAIGTNNLDNAARICHAPSTFALKASLGVAATTCSYRDLIGTDLVVFLGSNVANNQPVVMKYLYYARKAGTRVAVVNPYREPAMERYFVPSDLESALFGTRMTDRFFLVRVGGDIAFLTGAAKHLLREGWVDRRFIEEHTSGFERFAALVEAASWEVLEQGSGLSREEMYAFAEMVGRAERAVFVWGMGITQHEQGEANVHAIINLALLKGFVGRPGCGLMPIRGHSGVQGGAEMGAYATAFPGGLPITPENARRLEELWGFPVPDRPGLTTAEMIEAAREGKIDVLVASGGGFNEVLPDPRGVEEALKRIPLRVHFDIVLSSQMLLDPGETVLLLPAATRYEMPGGVTETTTERRVVLSPEIPGPRIGEARPEWEVYLDLARRVRPQYADRLSCRTTAELREEIARCIPFYDGIQHLRQGGESFQYGGPLLCQDWRFPTADGRAHFSEVPLPIPSLGPDQVLVATRRGKQFNSIVQEDTDPITAAPRDAVLMHPNDLRRFGLREGEAVDLVNAHGQFRGRAFAAEVHPGTVQIYWPEGNVLVDPTARSPQVKIPAYKAVVATVRRVEVATSAAPVVRP
jgi:molybdopterin-dependent oxidoreductase alpha subunit